MKASKDFEIRRAAAKKWRNKVEPDIKSVLRFCAHGRQNDFDARDRKDTDPDQDTFTSLPEDLATDLAGDLVNYFMPTEAKWASYEVITEVPEEIADQVEALVQERESAFFDFLDASNFNDLKPQIMFEAAAHGTPAIWVTSGHLMQPLYFEVVTPDELLVTPGHMGVLDRFRETHVDAQTLPALIPNGKFEDATRRKMEKPGNRCKVCWGFWVNWEDPGNPKWMQEIHVDEKPVIEKMELGPINGACPLLVGRFNPQPGRPWGRGAGIKGLPDILTLNKIEEVILSKLDEQLDPAWTYVDDGILKFDNGIESGMAYPRRSKEVPQPMLAPSQLDYGFYTREELESRLRTIFYQDGPRQRGDTPPTASQWIDERRRVQQRLGKPSAPLWSELLVPLIQRVEYIGTQVGALPAAISLNGRDINLRPMSPLQKSHNQDQANIARSNMELAFAILQDQVGTVIDPIETLRRYVRATGDEITVIREEQQRETPQAG